MKYLIIKDDLQGNIWHAIKRNFNDEKRIDVVVDDIMNILLKACEKKEIGSVEQKPSKKVEINIEDAKRIIESTNYLVVKSNKSFIHLQEAIEKAEREEHKSGNFRIKDFKVDQISREEEKKTMSKKVEIDVDVLKSILETYSSLNNFYESDSDVKVLKQAIEKADREEYNLSELIDTKMILCQSERIDQLEKKVEGLEKLIDRDRKEYIEIVAALKKDFSDQVKLLKDKYDLHYDTNKKIQQLQVQVYTFDKKLNSARVCPDNNNIYFDIDD